jgi:hypothetical protein
VLPIVRSHREVRFKFILSPLHLWQFWFNAAKRSGNLAAELAMIESLGGEPNVEVHDLTGVTALTHDSARYDTMHYDLDGAREVVDALASGSTRITSIAEHNEMLRREIEAGGRMVEEAKRTECP